MKVNFGLSVPPHETIGKEDIEVDLIYLILNFLANGYLYFDGHDIAYALLELIGHTVEMPQYGKVTRYVNDGLGDRFSLELQTELGTYGLTNIARIQRFDRVESAHEFTNKMYRFKYWMEYNSLLPDTSLKHTVTLREKNAELATDRKLDSTEVSVLSADSRISLAKRRKAWRINGEGTAAATQAVKEIFDRLSALASWSNESTENVRVQPKADDERFELFSGKLRMQIVWSCPTDLVKQAFLTVATAEMAVQDQSPSPETVRDLWSSTLQVDVDSELNLKWYRKDSSRNESYSSNDLADYCWTTFVDAIARQEENTE